MTELTETLADVAALIPRYSWEIMDEEQRDELMQSVVLPRYMQTTADGVQLGPKAWAGMIGATPDAVDGRVRRLKQSQNSAGAEASRTRNDQASRRHARKALQTADRQQIQRIVQDLPPAQKAALAAEALSDPRAARDAVADPAVDNAITAARHGHLEDRLAVEAEHTGGKRLDPDLLTPTAGDEKRERFEKALASAVVVSSVLRELSNDNELLVVSAANAGQYRERLRWALEGMMAADEQWEIVENTNSVGA